jgi:hypothetical protein
VPHYYFHVTNSIGLVKDEEGRELGSVEAARKEALDDIRSILSEEVRRGSVDLRGKVEITDENGHLFTTIPFNEAVELRLRDADAQVPQSWTDR